jgi:hypothetical protein
MFTLIFHSYFNMFDFEIAGIMRQVKMGSKGENDGWNNT